MIDGFVNDALEPIVEIGLVKTPEVTPIKAIVDTGFGGWLCLSEQCLEQIDLTFKFIEHYELANGDVIVEDVFRGRILFGGREQDVDVILTHSQDTLIGASLLDGHRLSIDYAGRSVHIE